MSQHDFLLIGASVVATLIVFSLGSRYLLTPPLRAVFSIDLGPTRNVSSVAELFPMLAPKECKYLEAQKWAIPRITVHRFQHCATVRVVYEFERPDHHRRPRVDHQELPGSGL